MGTPFLDNEFSKFWKKLPAMEKEMNDTRKKLIIAERESYLQDKGEGYSWDKVKAMARNKDQRTIS